jgi:hypothetical protein
MKPRWWWWWGPRPLGMVVPRKTKKVTVLERLLSFGMWQHVDL